ncbi:hypothetical protein KY358_05440 [Candidatus Woesearchaeota archaeon]|nr:hypothetical protein [Candidatus Woesearchaeota archaeon]
MAENKTSSLENIIGLGSGGLVGYAGLSYGKYLAPLVTHAAMDYLKLSYYTSSFLGFSSAVGLGALGLYGGYKAGEFAYKNVLEPAVKNVVKPVVSGALNGLYFLDNLVSSVLGFFSGGSTPASAPAPNG